MDLRVPSARRSGENRCHDPVRNASGEKESPVPGFHSCDARNLGSWLVRSRKDSIMESMSLFSIVRRRKVTVAEPSDEVSTHFDVIGLVEKRPGDDLCRMLGASVLPGQLAVVPGADPAQCDELGPAPVGQVVVGPGVGQLVQHDVLFRRAHVEAAGSVHVDSGVQAAGLHGVVELDCDRRQVQAVLGEAGEAEFDKSILFRGAWGIVVRHRRQGCLENLLGAGVADLSPLLGRGEAADPFGVATSAQPDSQPTGFINAVSKLWK